MADWEDAPTKSSGWEDAPAEAKNPYSAKDILGGAVKGSLSNLESVIRGSGAGVASMAGIPGTLSELGQKGVNLASEKFGGKKVFDEKTSLPTAEGIFQKTLKAVPRITAKRQESAGMEELGSLYSPSLAPSAYTGALKTLGSAIKGGEKGVDYVQKARGVVPKQEAEALSTELLGKTKPLISEAETAQAKALKEQERLSKAQTELGKREPVATARQEKREKEVESNLDKLSPKKNVLEEDVGGVIQNQGSSNVENLQKTRKEEAITEIKDPAFEASRAKEKKNDFIATNKESAPFYQDLVKTANEIIDRTPEMLKAEQRKRLSSFMGESRPMTEEELWRRTPAQRKTNVTTVDIRPMTMDQAEGMRRYLNDKNAQKIEGFASLDGQQAGDLSAKLQNAMKAFEPRSAQWIEKYRESSEPISKALAGRGKALTELEMVSLDKEAEAMFASDKTQASKYFLDGTEERAKRLLDLTGGKNKTLTDAITGHLRNQLEGKTSKQIEQFIRDNEGMLRVFPEFKKPMQDVALAQSVVEKAPVTAEKRATSASTRLSGQAGMAGKTFAEKQKIIDKYQPLINKLETSAPKEVIKDAESLVDNMLKDKVINSSAHKLYLQRISQINEKFKDSRDASTRIKQLLYGTLGIATTAVIAPRIL